MITQHESGSLNGAASLYLMIGELRQGQRHLESGLQDVRSTVERLDGKVDRLVRKKREPRAWIQSLDISPKQWLLIGLGLGMGVTGTLTPEVFRTLLLGH
jgi:hypothetical protein